jgi:hypothetical protein
VSGHFDVAMLPDFVIIGIPREDGWVQLLASRELGHVELRAEWNHRYITDIEYLDPVSVQRTNAHYLVTADLRTYIFIAAPDYPTAFSYLFEKWAPPRTDRKGIGEQRAIEMGQGEIGG